MWIALHQHVYNIGYGLDLTIVLFGVIIKWCRRMFSQTFRHFLISQALFYPRNIKFKKQQHFHTTTTPLLPHHYYTTTTTPPPPLHHHHHYTTTTPPPPHHHHHFQNISRTFPEHFQNISRTFPEHFQNISRTFPEHFQNISRTFPEHSHTIPRISRTSCRTVVTDGGGWRLVGGGGMLPH